MVLLENVLCISEPVQLELVVSIEVDSSPLPITGLLVLLRSSHRCICRDLPGDRGSVGDPLEQCGRFRLAPPGRGEEQRQLLGIMLPGARLQCRVEPGGALCATELLQQRALSSHVSTPAPHRVPGAPAAAFKEHHHSSTEKAEAGTDRKGKWFGPTF